MGRFSKELAEFRQAIDGFGQELGNVNILMDLLTKLLPYVEPRREILELGLELFRLHLPEFEQYQPEETWVREVLVDLETQNYSPVGLNLLNPNYYSSPGSNTFIDGVSHLWMVFNAFGLYDSVHRATYAINDLIFAGAMNAWAKNYPELWTRHQQLLEQFADEELDAQAEELLNLQLSEIPFLRDSDSLLDRHVIRLFQERWTLVADRLEVLLKDA